LDISQAASELYTKRTAWHAIARIKREFTNYSKQISIPGICGSAMSLSIAPHAASVGIAPHTASTGIAPYTAPITPEPIAPYAASPPLLLDIIIVIIGLGRTITLRQQVIVITNFFFGGLGARCLRNANRSSHHYRRPFTKAGQK
jgi:hypothetical protein